MVTVYISHTIGEGVSSISSLNWGRGADVQESRYKSAGEQVYSLIYREQNTSREDKHGVESRLDLPVGFPFVHAEQDEYKGGPNKEAVVDPSVWRATAKEYSRAKDAPENGLRVVVPGLHCVPSLGDDSTDQFRALVVDNEAHHAVVDEWTEESSPDLANEHFLFWNLHVKTKFVIGNQVQILFENLTAVNHAGEDCERLPGEHSTSDDFAQELHSHLRVGNAPENSVGESENTRYEGDDNEAPGKVR